MNMYSQGLMVSAYRLFKHSWGKKLRDFPDMFLSGPKDKITIDLGWWYNLDLMGFFAVSIFTCSD